MYYVLADVPPTVSLVAASTYSLLIYLLTRYQPPSKNGPDLWVGHFRVALVVCPRPEATQRDRQQNDGSREVPVGMWPYVTIGVGSLCCFLIFIRFANVPVAYRNGFTSSTLVDPKCLVIYITNIKHPFEFTGF